MSKTLTATDRKSLIRLASTMAVGSPERRAILAGLASAGLTAQAKPHKRAQIMVQSSGGAIVDLMLVTPASEATGDEDLDRNDPSAKILLKDAKAVQRDLAALFNLTRGDENQVRNPDQYTDGKEHVARVTIVAARKTRGSFDRGFMALQVKSALKKLGYSDIRSQ